MNLYSSRTLKRRAAISKTAGFRAFFEIAPLINEAKSSQLAKKAVETILGEDAVYDFPAFTGSEDFACYLQGKPGYVALVGSGKLDEEIYPLHHSKFNVDEECILNGAALFVQYTLEAQKEVW